MQYFLGSMVKATISLSLFVLRWKMVQLMIVVNDHYQFSQFQEPGRLSFYVELECPNIVAIDTDFKE